MREREIEKCDGTREICGKRLSAAIEMNEYDLFSASLCDVDRKFKSIKSVKTFNLYPYQLDVRFGRFHHTQLE